MRPAFNSSSTVPRPDEAKLVMSCNVKCGFVVLVLFCWCRAALLPSYSRPSFLYQGRGAQIPASFVSVFGLHCCSSVANHTHP